MTSITDLRLTKTCHLCSKHIDGHLFGSDYTCRTCQHECRRIEPLFRSFATLLTSLQREHTQSIKGVKEELVELKNMLSSRQQKASNTLKGLKDDISQIKSEVDVLKLIKTKGGDGEGLKKVAKELEDVKKEVLGLDHAISGLYANLEESESEQKARQEDLREDVEEIEDFTRRLKEAFVGLAGPEETEVEKEKEERLKEVRETKEGLKEVQGFMIQMQKAFMMLPTQGSVGVKENGAPSTA